jgi:hypothetical protein
MQRFRFWIVGVKMSKDCNLIAGTEVGSSKKAAINVIHELDEEHFECQKEQARNALSVVS